MVTICTVDVPERVKGGGAVQVTPRGADEGGVQVSEMVPLNPLTDLKFRLKVEELPARRVMVVLDEPLESPTLKSDPVPVSAPVKVAPLMLVAKVTVPLRVPAAVGLKTTVTEQVALTTTDVPLQLVPAL